MFAHLSFFVFGILGPIIIMLTKGKESPFVRDQAVEALNFHITIMIALFVSAVLIIVFIGFILFFVVIIYGLVFSIIGAVAANKGTAYRYPVNLRMVH
ncbi:MAG: DUF4870 domain-containing protein [Actinomycetota bacterium]|nr:DUF4870 domain-containing protein [Actinomycetota bacterium]